MHHLLIARRLCLLLCAITLLSAPASDICAAAYPVTGWGSDDNASSCGRITLTALPVVTPEPAEPTLADLITQTAASDPAEFEILLRAVQAADPRILAALSDPSASLTVFAPTDTAFQRFFDRTGLTTEQLLADQILLNNLLIYQVVVGEYDATTLFDLASQRWPHNYLRTLHGTYIEFTGDDDSLTANDARVQTDALQAENGILYAIDTVLDPPYAWRVDELPLGGDGEANDEG
ncbi:MAG: fasciclin domain-containing protein [Anaerolineae bacterium]|nr:fasciclin domain-containing protein [Anaerolineae bacterium]